MVGRSGQTEGPLYLLQQHPRLHMVGIGELIEQSAPHYAVRFCKRLQVVCQGFRIAGDVENAPVILDQVQRGGV